MAIHFSDIGFELDEYDFLDELTEFAEENMTAARQIAHKGKTSLMVPVDDCIEMWFPVIEGEIIYDGVQPHYRTGNRFTAKLPSWVDFDGNGMSAMLKVMHGDAYPLNLNVPCADLLPELQADTELSIELACFAEELDFYEDEADFTENCAYGEGFAAKSVIPTGCYAAFGNDDVAETPRAMLTGIVTAAELMTNSYSGLDYWKLTVDTLDGNVTMLAAEELVYDEPQPGNVVMGKVWFSGNI